MTDHPSTVWNLISTRAEQTPDALLAADERGRHMTFGEYRNEAEAVAAGLLARGVTRDTVVSWQLPTWIESMVLAGALARLGAVQNPIIPANREREVGFIVRQLETRLLIVPSVWRGFDFGSMAKSLQIDRPEMEVLLCDRDLPRGDPSTLPLPPPLGDGHSVVRWVLYTSGTTADPKGARHTDTTLMQSAIGMCARMRMTGDDRNAIAFPFTHIGGMTLLFADLLVGSASILLEAFSDEGIEVLAREGVTLAGSGTPFNLAYLRAQRLAGERRLFPRIRAFPGGGSTRPAQLHHEMKAAFGGTGILSGYGLTETGFLAMADVDDPDGALSDTEGRAYPGAELRIVTADGAEAAAFEEGEICARGPMVMRGYVDSSLDDAFDDEGFFHTGDLGTLDADGYLRITGRLKDIIIRKGENISGREIEDLLYAHPAVLESAAIGLPDVATGERCCAVVVLYEGKSVTLPEITAYLREQGLSTFKLPEQLEIVDELPKNASGKVTKHVLQKRYAEVNAS